MKDMSFGKAICGIGLCLLLAGYVENSHAITNYKLVETKEFNALTKKRTMIIDGIEMNVKPDTFKAKSVESAAGYDLMCAKIKGETLCKAR